MNLIEAINTFNGVMDTDHADKDVAQGNYRELMCGENGYTELDENGNVINCKSNLLIGNPFLTPNIVRKKIGDFEDKQGESIIYLIAESGGAHGIYRWYRHVDSLTFGRIEKIFKLDNAGLYTLQIPNPFNFSFDSQFAVTGCALVGNLFSWTDYLNRPRCFDIVRANETNKKRKFNVTFNRSNFTETSTYTLGIYAFNTLAPVFTMTWDSSQLSYSGRNQDFINAYNVSATANQHFTIINNYYYSQIELVQVGYFVVNIEEVVSAVPATNQSICVPDNFYPDYDSGIPAGATFDLFTEDYIDFVKYLPLCCPTVVSGRDESVSGLSLIANKVFQFCLRYKYKNYEKARLGAYSNIAVYSVDGSGTQTPTTDNYIEITFTDPRLTNKGLVSMIDKIDLCVREHNTGQWRVFQTLNQYEFAGTGLQQIYRFYNNEGTIEIIPTIDEVEQVDAVPLLAKSLENAEDRIFFGGNVDGYNKIPINANINIDYTNTILEDTYSIAGIIVIRTAFNTGFPTHYNQPLYGKTVDIYGWGGFEGTFVGGQAALGNPTQTFPDNKKLNGFVPYLAGTDNYAISVQNVQYTDGTYPLQYGAQGNLVDAVTPSHISDIIIKGCCHVDDIRSNPFNLGIGALTSPANGAVTIGDSYGAGTGIFFSRFELRNVKPGKYVLRMASPSEVTLDILNNGTKEYQQTSASMFSVGGTTGFEFLVTVSEADAIINPLTGRKTVFVGVTEVADMNNPGGDCTKIIGYLTDEYNGTAPTTYTEALAKPRINYAKVNPNNGFSGSKYSKYTLLSGTTDHNGYFYFASDQPSNFNPDTVNQGEVGTYAMTAPPSFVMFNRAGGSFVNTPYEAIISCTIPTTVEIATNRRTHITGSVTDASGKALEGVNVVPLKCQWQHTINGFYSIVTYTETPLDQKVIEVLYQSGSAAVSLQIVAGTNSYFLSSPVTIDITSVDYNDVTSYVLATVLFDVLSIAQSKSTWKPGSDEQFGLVYYDAADRRCGVTTNENLKKHILFLNEKDANGNLQPTGERILSWQIFNEPPIDAVKYQWARTLNLQHGLYLWWCVNKIEYVDDIDTNVGYNSPAATLGKINFDNVPFYTINKYPGAIINFGFQVGDRIRVVTGTVYEESEIVKIIEPYYYIRKSNKFELTQGTLVELYHPREQSDTNIFYEFGECYPVLWGQFFGVWKKYHVGDTQDQSYGSIPLGITTPATGVFKTGNSWIRYRNIPINVTAATQSDPAINGGQTTQLIYDGSISDFYKSDDVNIGRPNSTELLGRISKPTSVRFGDLYRYGSKINDLCTFRALNEKTYNFEYGLLNKLILVKSDVMYMIFHNSYTLSAYLGKAILRDLAEASIVAISDDVMSKAEKMQRTFGTQDPATVQLNDEGDVMFYDQAQGIVARASGNGLINIAEYLMKGWWNDTSKQRRNRTTQNRAIATYNIFRDKYIISLPLISQSSDVFPSVIISLPNFEANTVIMGYLSLQPSTPLFVIPLIYSVWNGNTNAAIAWYLSAIGYTVTTLNDGSIKVVAPNMVHSQAVLTIKTTAADLISYTDSTCDYVGSWVTSVGAWSNDGHEWKCGNAVGFSVSQLTLKIPPMMPNTDYILKYDINNRSASTDFELVVNLGGTEVANYQPVISMNESIPLNTGAIVNQQLDFVAVITNTTTEYISINNVHLIPVTPVASQNFSFTFDKGISQDRETSPAYTLAFQKQSAQIAVQGWKNYYPFTPEGFSKLRNEIVSFVNGELYLHEAGVGYNNFYGVQYKRTLKYVVNQDTGVTKGFKAISTFSRNNQDVPEISIPATVEYPNGMRSRLVKANFRIFNGELYSETLRDETDPTFTDPLQALINGRPLQGEEAIVTIEDDSVEQSALKYCKMVYFYISKF